MSQRKPRRPHRLFRHRPSRDSEPEKLPGFPSELINKLKMARERIDPFRTYRMRMPDGSVHELSGADAIATAEAHVSLAEAVNRGEDPQVLKAKFERLFRTLG
jgi:hypothetical protein